MAPTYNGCVIIEVEPNILIKKIAYYNKPVVMADHGYSQLLYTETRHDVRFSGRTR